MSVTESRKFRFTLTERLLGTCPPKEVYEKYVLGKAPVPDDEESIEELETVAGQTEKKLITRFHQDPDGVYLLDYQIKGFLKEAGNILKDTLANSKSKKSGVKNLRSKIDNYVFVFPRYVWLKEAPDGEFARTIRCQTPQGPRVAIGCAEYIEPGTSFDLKIDLFPHAEITWELIEQLLDFGAYKGIGQFRNGSYGRFTWEVLNNGNGNGNSN